MALILGSFRTLESRSKQLRVSVLGSEILIHCGPGGYDTMCPLWLGGSVGVGGGPKKSPCHTRLRSMGQSARTFKVQAASSGASTRTECTSGDSDAPISKPYG